MLFYVLQKKEAMARQRELANSHLMWEKGLKEEERKKKEKLRSLEEERLLKQEQSDAIAKMNIEKQVG